MAYSKNRRLAEIVSDTLGNLSVEGIVVPTQSSSDNDTSAASTAFVHAHIDAVLDSAPGTLNTLNEIAAALNDDANFNTTISNAIAAKLPLAGGTMTGALVVNHSEVLFDNTSGDFTLKLNTNAVGDKNEIIMGDTGTPLAKFGVGGTANDIITGSDGQDFNIGTAGGGRAINFSTDNFGSVEMKLDGGKLGIGTTTPAQTLDVKGRVQLTRPVASGHASEGNWDINISHEDAARYGSLYITPSVSTAEISLMSNKFRFTNTGRLGIGTATPARLLEVSGSGRESRFTRSGSAGTTMEFYSGASPAGGIQVQSTGLGISGGTGENHVFINTSGTLLVGTTDDAHYGSSSNSGFAVTNGGITGISRDSGTVLYLNRQTNDGDIITFRKNGSLIGHVGTYGGAFYVGGSTNGSNGSGLMFNGVDIEPTTGSTGRTDGAIDLGSSNFRFQHIRFSGGLYGGGELQLSRVGIGVAAATSVAGNSSNTEGIFFHNSTGSYNIGRTPGSWVGPNYTQLKLDWDTGIIIDGGTAYGKSGVHLKGPVASSHGGMILQTLEAYNSTAITTTGSSVTVVESATFPILQGSRIAVWFNSGQVSNPNNASNPNFQIQWVNSGGTSTVISDQNSNHYWYDIGKGTGARVNMVGQAISPALNADTYSIRVVGNVYNGTATWNYQSQGAHIIIQEISEAL